MRELRIYSTDPNEVKVGLHYNSDCDLRQLDRQALGTLTNFNTWTATKNQIRDDALENANTPWTDPKGYPGKHGGRDDVSWLGHRYSLGEAQNSTDTPSFANWRWALYDYDNATAYPVFPKTAYPCVANPKLTRVTDATGRPELVVTGFLFGAPAGCAPPEIAGEFSYVVPAP